MYRPLRLTIDRTAIQENWRWLQDRAGVPAGAAVKADGYGLGAREAAHALYEAGCRDFFVSSWAEAEALGPMPLGTSVVVLHGAGPKDAEAALSLLARPCLNTPDQVARWKEVAPERPCDVMVDTGMNRLGLRPTEIGLLDGLAIETLHSHLANLDDLRQLRHHRIIFHALFQILFRFRQRLRQRRPPCQLGGLFDLKPHVLFVELRDRVHQVLR